MFDEVEQAVNADEQEDRIAELEAENKRLTEAVEELLEQVRQMESMFDDADGAIAKAVALGESALEVGGEKGAPCPDDMVEYMTGAMDYEDDFQKGGLGYMG